MPSAVRLLATRRFLPFFVTLLTGAYNDNVFRYALVALITFRLVELGGFGSGELVAASAGVFLLPFLLFSAVGGMLADRMPRHLLIRRLKITETVLMLLAWLGFWLDSVGFLFVVLFLTGLQSALFGPVKYAVLPNLLARRELLGGNALVATGTFLAILAGTVTGTGLMAASGYMHWVPGLLVASAGLGYLTSLLMPAQPAGDAAAPLTFEPFGPMLRVLRDGMRQPDMARLMLAISWFWMIGITVLTQLPLLARDTLAGDEQTLTAALAIFVAGLGGGALLCNRVLRGRARAVWTPLAALAMGAAFWRLGLTAPLAAAPAEAMGLLRDPQAAGILGTLLLLAVLGGFYVVPLYTLLQQRAQNERRARIIACNNILNAGAMVLASLIAFGTFRGGGTLETLWLAMAASVLAPVLIMLNFSGGSLRRLLLWPAATLELAADGDRQLPRGCLVFTRYANPWAAWSMAAAIPGPLELHADPELLQRPAMRLLALWVRLRPLDAAHAAVHGPRDDGDLQRTLVLLPPRRGEATLPALMQAARQHCDRPVALASATEPSRHMPRFHPHLQVMLRACPLPAPRRADAAAARRDACAMYDMLAELEYHTRYQHCTTLQSLHSAARRFGGNHVVLSDSDRSFTYRRLLQSVYALAGLLGRTLPASQRAVGLLLPTAAATPVAFFAMHALRRVPVMLNYTAGPANIASACRTADLTHIVTSRRFIDLAGLQDVAALLEQQYTLLWLEDLLPKLGLGTKLAAVWRARRPAPDGNPDDPAAVLFTSGSESEPKGVVLSHANLHGNRCQVRAVLDFTPHDRLLLCLPLYHSFALGVGMLLPLAAGIHCVLYPNPTHYKHIPELIRTHAITIFFSTDTFLNGYDKAATAADLASLRLLVAGAEALKPSTRKAWLERFGIKVREGYGVTETAPALSANTPDFDQPGSVGRLMPCIEARLQPLEDGAASHGRLFVRGPNVMTGYWLPGSRRALTPPADGWHDTGDVAEFDADGFLTLRGRAKRFAKIGGEMVSLAQIEQRVSDIWPEHRHVVCAVAHPTRGQQLVLITERPGPDLNELREALSAHGIAELARPRQLVPVGTLPILGSGKPDLRQAQALAESVLH